MTPQEFATAIGAIESGSNALTWGDFTGNPYLPQAGGRFQMHYDWLWTWAFKQDLVPAEDETRDAFEQRALEHFYSLHSPAMSDVAIAVYFHLGHIAQPTDPDWNDQNYAARFETAAGI